MEAMHLSGVVLAAGRSTRMGRDKALLPAPEAGEPMWARQRAVLAVAGAAEIFLSARPEQAWTREARGFAAVLHDALPECGPIVGITAALERASTATHVAVLAIDLPRLPAAWFRELRALCAPGRGAVGRRGEFFEPLAAIYPRALMWPAWEALARGDYSLQALLRRGTAEGLMAVREIAPTDAAAGWLENRNAPESADAAALRAGSRA